MGPRVEEGKTLLAGLLDPLKGMQIGQLSVQGRQNGPVRNLNLRLAVMATALTSVASMAQGVSGGQVFDASRHQKSQGAQLTVTYPAGFTARENNRQRIVQSFTGN